MSINQFLNLVEIRTKLASFIPFTLGTAYAIYRYNVFNLTNFIIMFISLITIDMATTAINNYVDNTKGYESPDENLIAQYGINKSKAQIIIYTLLAIATTAGIILTLKTNIVVLFIGIISFIVGIFYTFGPIPISRMPLGEVFSGVIEGLLLIFLSVYVQIYDTNIIVLAYENNILNIAINLYEVFIIFLVSVPSMLGISNIMLANNICDLEEDIKNNRFTLPYYIGKGNALNLFKILYYIGYIDVIILVILKILPITSLLILLTFIVINKNIKLFAERPVKNENFVLSVKNFVLVNASQIIIIALAILIR